MSNQSALTRAQLLRLLLVALGAVAAVIMSVGGMVAYSAHVVDALSVQTRPS